MVETWLYPGDSKNLIDLFDRGGHLILIEGRDSIVVRTASGSVLQVLWV